MPQDDAEAVRWYRLAADQGYADAQCNLGFMYDTGEGVPQDDAEAVRWYRLAADQGNAVAQGNLGTMYAFGRGVPEDDAEAVRWFRLAADQGDAVARSMRTATWRGMLPLRHRRQRPVVIRPEPVRIRTRLDLPRREAPFVSENAASGAAVAATVTREPPVPVVPRAQPDAATPPPTISSALESLDELGDVLDKLATSLKKLDRNLTS